jgi:integrase
MMSDEMKSLTPLTRAEIVVPSESTTTLPWQRVYRGKDAQYAQRDLVILTVALATGLRAAELADLNVGDLYETNGTRQRFVQNWAI